MQKLFILICILVLTACSKSYNYPGSIPKRTIFKNPEQAFEVVQKQVTFFHADEKVETIEKISYLYSENTICAFVFYKSNRGHRNLVIEKHYQGEVELASAVKTCDGESCDCKVQAIIRSDGHADVSCSCSSCTMLINQGLQ